jgi:serine/threonine protein kinase
LVNNENVAKLIDFGLVKKLDGENTSKITKTIGFSERTSAYEYLVDNKVS